MEKTIEEIRQKMFERLTPEQRARAETNMRIAALKRQLVPLNEDILQVQAGAIIPGLEQKKARFIAILNEIRALQGKPPREIASEEAEDEENQG